MSDMDITCKRCGARILADDLNIQTMVAKCRSCNGVFGIADQIEPADGFAPPARRDVPIPDRFTIEHPAGGLRISWRWFTPVMIFVAIFVVFWDSIICVSLIKGAASVDGISALIATLFIVIALGLTYLTLTAFLNTTRVDASPSALLVRHGPLPSWGNRTLPRDGLRQLYCIERVHGSDKHASVSYDLQAIKADGSCITVIQGIPTAEQALYLEQELERFLGITDEAVRDELRK